MTVKPTFYIGQLKKQYSYLNQQPARSTEKPQYIWEWLKSGMVDMSKYISPSTYYRSPDLQYYLYFIYTKGSRGHTMHL